MKINSEEEYEASLDLAWKLWYTEDEKELDLLTELVIAIEQYEKEFWPIDHKNLTT